MDLGGWSNPVSVDYFVDYARVAFNLYGDIIKTWTTMNEPHQHCFNVSIHNKVLQYIFFYLESLCFYQNNYSITGVMFLCLKGYGSHYFVPALMSHGIGEYLCYHYILLAHAKAYHVYKKEFRPYQRGKYNFINNC